MEAIKEKLESIISEYIDIDIIQKEEGTNEKEEGTTEKEGKRIVH